MYRWNNRDSVLKGHSKSIKEEVIENYIINEMEKSIFIDAENSHRSKELTKFCDVKQKHMEDELKFIKNKLSN